MCRGEGSSFLIGGQDGLIEKIASEQRLAGSEGGSREDTWKSIPGTGHSLCEGHEAGACLVC